jgi:hypothetical protein
MRIMETVGVSRWEALPGKQAIILYAGSAGWGGRSIGIASLTDSDRVLILEDHAQAWKDRVTA